MRAHRLTRREFLSAAGALPVAAALPRLGHAAARPITVVPQRLDVRLRPAPGGAGEEVLRGGGAQPCRASSCPGGGAKVVQALAAGQAMFGLGDSNHPLKTTEKGKDAVILFATDTRCSYANVVVRKELYDRGVKSGRGARRPEARRPQGGGRRHRHRLRHATSTACYVLKSSKARRRQAGERPRGVGRRRRLHHHAGRAQGREVRRDHGGAGVAVGRRGPRGSARPIYDVQDEKAWNRVFGGPIPVTVGYVPQGDHREVARPRAGLRQRLLPRAAVDPQGQGRGDRRAPPQAVHGHLHARGRPEVRPLLQDASSTGTSSSTRRTTRTA